MTGTDNREYGHDWTVDEVIRQRAFGWISLDDATRHLREMGLKKATVRDLLSDQGSRHD